MKKKSARKAHHKVAKRKHVLHREVPMNMSVAVMVILVGVVVLALIAGRY